MIAVAPHRHQININEWHKMSEVFKTSEVYLKTECE